jgi:hypothetical protein
MKKKKLAIFIAIAFCLGACSSTEQTQSPKQEEEQKQEEKYQKTLQEIETLIENGDYATAYEKATQTRNEDFTEKQDEVFTALIFYSSSKRDKVLENWENASLDEQGLKASLTVSAYENIPEDYDGPFSKEINQEKEIAVEIIKHLKESILKEAVQSIKAGNYEDTWDSWSAIAYRSELIKKEFYNDPTYIALKGYNDALLSKEEEDWSGFYNQLKDIPTDYNGPLSQEIKGLKVEYKEQISEQIEENARIQEELNKVEPAIGMTKEEVLASTWGKPEDINITETQYGTSEQWVYYGFRYIYFEDGIVTTIQK